MDDVDSDVGAMIVQNIEVFQAAFEYAETRMNDLLGKKVIKIFEAQQKLIKGDGDEPEELGDIISIASPAWRIPSDSDATPEHKIWLSFEGTGDDEKIWLSEFAGVQGAGIILKLSTVLKKKQFREMLKNNFELQDGFRSLGMTIDPGVGFVLPIKFDRELLAQGFADEDLTEALEPLAAGLRHIFEANELTTALLQAICAIEQAQSISRASVVAAPITSQK